MKKLSFLLCITVLLCTSKGYAQKSHSSVHSHASHAGIHSGGHSSFGHGGMHSSHIMSHSAARSGGKSISLKGPRNGGGHHTTYGPRSSWQAIIKQPHAPIPIHNYHHHRYIPYVGYWINYGAYYHPYWFRRMYPGYADSEQMNNIYGYVVYNNDTIAGQAYMNEDVIAIKGKDSTDSAQTFAYTDSNLHCITLYSNGQEMYLVRLKEKDNEFWRVIHAGRLNLYDDNFSFSFEPKDIDFDKMQVRYNGELEPLEGDNPFANDKRRLIYYINKAYGLDMNPKYFNKKEVLSYLQTLD